MEYSGGGRLAFAAGLAQANSIAQLADRLYAGAGELFGPVSVGFDLFDPGTHRVQHTSAHGVSAFFLALYERKARDSDPVLGHAVTTGELAYNRALMSDSEWQGSKVYREVFSLHRITELVYVPVVLDGTVVATLNLGKGKEQGAFNRRHLQEATDLAEILAPALAALDRNARLNRKIALYRSAFDLLDEPVVITDYQQAVRYENGAARAVLSERGSDGRGLDDELALSSMRRGERAEASEPLVKRASELWGGEAQVAILRATSCSTLPEWLQLSLTERESDVVKLVMQGHRDAEIAQELNLSVHTVKGYLREALKKTGTRSRVELAWMALGRNREQIAESGTGQLWPL